MQTNTDHATKSFERPLSPAYKKHRILLTGDLGFIGSRLKDRLREMGHDVIGLDLKWGAGNDIRVRQDVMNAFTIHKPTVVYHLAALAGVIKGEEHPQDFMDTNVVGTMNIIEACKLHKVGQLIFFSSSSVYGNQTPPNHEGVATSPISTYGATKVIGELKVQESGLNWTIIRPFTVYGENGRQDMVIYKWINEVQAEKPIHVRGDGSSKRGYAYVGDVAEGAALALDNPKAFGEIFNLGGVEIISIQQVADVFKEVFQEAKVVYDPMPDWDVNENWADISKARELLGWEPKGQFINKLREILHGFRA